jgi:hypothetical protein
LVTLTVNFTDGSSTVVVSDESWSGREGAHTFDSVYHGEVLSLFHFLSFTFSLSISLSLFI